MWISAGPFGAPGCDTSEPAFHPSVFPSILPSFHPSFHPSILRLLFACSVCLFASACLLFACFHLLFAAIVWLLVGPRRRQFTTQNHIALIQGLPEFACGPSAVHIFAFEPYQARIYMHQTCHSTAICPESPPKTMFPYFWGYLNSLVARSLCTISLLSPTKPAPICITPAIRRLYAQNHPTWHQRTPKVLQSHPKMPLKWRKIEQAGSYIK